MELTLNHMVEIIIGLAIFLVLLSIIVPFIYDFIQNKSTQELFLEKIEDRISYLERDSCRSVLFASDTFNFVLRTPDIAPGSCAKGSPCACISFQKEPNELFCKNFPSLKNKCEQEGLCYEKLQNIAVIDKNLKLCADERGQLTYGGI